MWTLYEKIKSLCVRKGISVSRMCVDIGMSKTTMSNLKNGHTNELTMTNMNKIADYFGIDVSELVDKKENTDTVMRDGVDPKRKAILELVANMDDEKFTKLVYAVHLLELDS